MKRSRQTVRTTGDDETFALGRAVGEVLAPGDFLGLEGPMGAGKTRLIQGICEGLGVDPRDVTSPTYALVNTYSGRLAVYHLDLYRVVDPEEVESTGVLDVAGDGVALVEWIDRAREVLPPGGVHVLIQDEGPELRDIRFEAPEGAPLLGAVSNFAASA
ncbi:MAG: tRNA (adenosine(37)-N6)-threonylcarbamoyltransferase complex ATPase subunit type 1 TsaE [Deltaproteobacteria bacterium]|nr:tRNA (adenosine(37)-N6)-threonylcarbamoyltransferase complex ATPase subunit type 1 TsaE [Deltaproteobacteria bacterium]